MGLFGKVFGKEDKKDSCCCDMEIVEVPGGRGGTCGMRECDSSGGGCSRADRAGAGMQALPPAQRYNAQAAASKAGGAVSVEYVTDLVR